MTRSQSVISQGGNRIDVIPDETTIFGIVRADDGVGVITFNSAYDGTGKATLTISGGNVIEWNITESYGEHYLPESATLHKVGD